MPAVSNTITIVHGKKSLKIDFLAHRKLDEHELERHAAVYLGSKNGRKMLRSGGMVKVITQIGLRDPIGGQFDEYPYR